MSRSTYGRRWIKGRHVYAAIDEQVEIAVAAAFAASIGSEHTSLDCSTNHDSPVRAKRPVLERIGDRRIRDT